MENLLRGVTNILPTKEELTRTLSSGKKLNIYLGIDPTSTKIHLGHSVLLRKLQAFVEMGHNVTFLIGDFTALIGDSSDKESERPVLTTEEINNNFQTYKEQAQKIVNFEKVKIVHNSEWLGKLTFSEIVKLCQNFSVGDFVGRELIKKRLSEGKKVGLHETLYPVMQGYDSMTLDTDIQIGGQDQLFNMLAGRTLIKNLKNRESFVITWDYLPGLDGKKMSKTGGNAIWITDAPRDMYGKIMSISDEVMKTYFLLLTELNLSEIDFNNPMNTKKVLAKKVVQSIHGEHEAKLAEEYFEKTFQEKSPDFSEYLDFPEGTTVAESVSHVRGSMRQSKDLIGFGSVVLNDTLVKDPKIRLKDGDKLQIGKKEFYTIKINEK